MTMFTTVPDFDFEPSSKSSSILMCDVPYLEGAQYDLPFRANTADVPDDLLACTPIHGWDTPPDSPVHNQMLESFADPLISTKVGMLFDGMDHVDLAAVSEKLEDCEPVFEWTPPASPVASSVPSSDCDTDFTATFPPDLDSLETPFDDVKPSSAPARAGGVKRKAGGAAEHKDDKRRVRQKLEAERQQRTEECDKAVKELSNTKTDDDPESRRHTHNVLERKRRNDLKNSYQQLREELPALEDNDRAPTGQILLHAVEYVKMLVQNETDLLTGIAAAKAENDRLKKLLGRKF